FQLTAAITARSSLRSKYICPEAGRDTRPTSPRTRTLANSPSITRFTAPGISETVYSGALPPGAGASSSKIPMIVPSPACVTAGLTLERAHHWAKGEAMNILVLGGGGREHALAWAIKQNPKCDRLIVAPGNAGIAALAECADLDILSGATVVTFCE